MSISWCSNPTILKIRGLGIAHTAGVSFQSNALLSLCSLYWIDLTGLVAMSVVCSAYGSSTITGDFEDIEAEFGVNDVVAALTVSIMVCGFGHVTFS